MYEQTFWLRQHTPLLHFLHEQPGATLRGTELKPKLDRFITGLFRKLPDGANMQFDGAIQMIKKAMVEKSPAPYRLSVQPPVGEPEFFYFDSNVSKRKRDSLDLEIQKQFNLSKKPEIVYPAPFFANTDKRKDGKWDEVKLGILYPGLMMIRVQTWDKRIADLLEKALPLLFCTENFGTRQSKGFGCFSERSVSEQMFEQVAKSSFVFAAKRRLPASQAEVLRVIDDTYKDLRNRPPLAEGQEARSLLRDYFRKQDPEVEWEKETITRILIHEEGERPDSDVRFVRAVLGLPGLHDYPQSPGRHKVNIREKSGAVERFRSPITFKVHGNSLYLLAHPTNQEMLGKTFQFFRGDFPERDRRAFELRSPDTFNIKDFLTKNLKNWNHV